MNLVQIDRWTDRLKSVQYHERTISLVAEAADTCPPKGLMGATEHRR